VARVIDPQALSRVTDVAKRAAERAVHDAVEKAQPEFLNILEERVKNIFNSAIDAFYADYSPDYYGRSHSLYDLMQIERGEESLSVWFEPKEMSSFRNGYNGEDGLYDQVFRKGWHGGAGGISEEKADVYGAHPGYMPGGNVPVWRTPVPYYTRWGRPAEVMSPSPLEKIKEDVDIYSSKQMGADFRQCLDKHLRDTRLKL